MKIKIYRGAEKIGGNVIELASVSEKILLDSGLPLDSEINRNEGIEELRERKILPDIKNLYLGEESKYSGVFITHSHNDHIGMIKYINSDIPVYMSKQTKRILDVTDIFNESGYNERKNIKIIEDKITTKDFDIEMFPIDHSAFDSKAFLIKEKLMGKTLFYTGDFRETGNNDRFKLFEKEFNQKKQEIDILITEGTLIDNSKRQFETESDVKNEISNILKNGYNICLCVASGQNIDRLLSIYNAAIENGYEFVIDPYIAYLIYEIELLKKINKFKILIHNYYGKGDIYVNRLENALKADENKEVMKYLGSHKIKVPNISKDKKYFIIIRSGTIRAIKKINDLNKAFLIYSMWEGYLKKEDNTFNKFIKENFSIEKGNMAYVHSSGHANIKTIKKMVDITNPKIIIPVHTNSPEKFKELFKDKNIITLRNREEFDTEKKF